VRRIGEHLANPDLNTINNSNLEQWPEKVGAIKLRNNFVKDRKMVWFAELYFATRCKLLFCQKMGHPSWENKGAKKKKL
jgi:hypothetical protein